MSTILAEITQNLDNIKDEIARTKLILKQLEKEEEKANMVLQGILQEADVKNMDYGVYTFGWKETSRTAFNQSLFKEEMPELFDKFKTTTVTEKFEFKINK